MSTRKVISAAVLVFSVLAAPAVAAPLGTELGARVGFGLEPDQLVVGVQTLLGHSVLNTRFAPSVDLGFGGDVTTFSVNADFLLPDLELPGSGTSFYFGAGPTLTYWDVDNGGSDTEIGISLVAGLRAGAGGSSRYTVESRFGFSDVPDFRLLLGVLF